MNRRDFIQATALGSLFTNTVLAADKPKLSKPDFTLQGVDVFGKKLDLRDYAGKTTLVSFFTFDCTVCTNDLKLMREFYVRNVSKKFVLIGVNIDQNKKDLDEYNEASTLAYPKSHRFPTVWRMAAGHQDNFGKITTTPTHFLLNAQHQLVLKREGAFRSDDWDNLWLSLS
jgi:peroxiredoxin